MTRSSYCLSVITLAYTLREKFTAYPLVVLITPSLSEECLRALNIECKHNLLLSVHPVEPLPPSSPVSIADARFKDTPHLRADRLRHHHPQER